MSRQLLYSRAHFGFLTAILWLDCSTLNCYTPEVLLVRRLLYSSVASAPQLLYSRDTPGPRTVIV